MMQWRDGLDGRAMQLVYFFIAAEILFFAAATACATWSDSSSPRFARDAVDPVALRLDCACDDAAEWCGGGEPGISAVCSKNAPNPSANDSR